MEKEHQERKKQASGILRKLDNPVYDAPLNIEARYSEEVINIAKRGRNCTLETAVMGRNRKKRDLRDRERSAKLRGKTEIGANTQMRYESIAMYS